MSLVLDGGNGTLLSPVNSIGNIINSEKLNGFGGNFRDKLSEVSLLEFLISQIEEHGLSKSGFTLGFIECLGVFDVVIENLESVTILTWSVFFVVGIFKLDELLLNVNRNTFFSSSILIKIDNWAEEG